MRRKGILRFTGIRVEFIDSKSILKKTNPTQPDRCRTAVKEPFISDVFFVFFWWLRAGSSNVRFTLDREYSFQLPKRAILAEIIRFFASSPSHRFSRVSGRKSFWRVWRLALTFASFFRGFRIVGRVLSGVRNGHLQNKKSPPLRWVWGRIPY